MLLPLTVVSLHLTSWNDKTCLWVKQRISLKSSSMPLQQRVVRQTCPNNECQFYGQSEKGNIIRYGFFGLKCGKRRRYRCKTCMRTFCSTSAPRMTNDRNPTYARGPGVLRPQRHQNNQTLLHQSPAWVHGRGSRGHRKLPRILRMSTTDQIMTNSPQNRGFQRSKGNIVRK